MLALMSDSASSAVWGSGDEHVRLPVLARLVLLEDSRRRKISEFENKGKNLYPSQSNRMDDC